MSLEPIHRASYFSCFESSNSCLQSKWFVVALAVSSLVFFGVAAFGGTGLFASQLPQWLAHAVGTVGHGGCLAMFMWGTLLGGTCAITAIVLVVKRSCNPSTHHTESFQTPDLEVREAEVTSLNEESETLNARLIDEVGNGRFGEVTTFLARGANIEATSEDGWTPLIFAAMWGRVDIVTTLLDRGANIEVTTADGRTALDLAGTDEVRQVLVNRRSELETLNAH